MYTAIYNRLCGWVFFALGMIGFTTGHLATYVRITTVEASVYTVIGLLGMLAARLRHRDATLCAVLLGISLFFWGISGFAWPVTWMGVSEPVENAIRIVAGVWGMYVAVNDVLAWRSALMHPET